MIVESQTHHSSTAVPTLSAALRFSSKQAASLHSDVIALDRLEMLSLLIVTVAQIARRSLAFVELFSKALRSFSANIDQSAPFPLRLPPSQ
jgi:hypothetical protein